MRRFRILIGDDHPLMLNGIKAFLERHHDVIGTETDGRQLVRTAFRTRPEVVVLDLSMPQLNGLEAAKEIRAAFPSVKLIFLSMHNNPLYLRKALGNGANGYVLKSGMIEELLEAIRRVTDGGTYLSPGLSGEVVTDLLSNSGKPSKAEEELTARQLEILQMISEGRTNKEIAHLLEISSKTVEFHRGRIVLRLGARSVSGAVRLAMELGLIVPRSPGVVRAHKPAPGEEKSPG